MIESVDRVTPVRVDELPPVAEIMMATGVIASVEVEPLDKTYFLLTNIHTGRSRMAHKARLVYWLKPSTFDAEKTDIELMLMANGTI